MKETIRRGVFETNSSSTHSLTMCKEDVYTKWKNGELYFSRWDKDFITKEEYEKILKKQCTCDRDDDYFEESDCDCDVEYMTYEKFWDDVSYDFETFEDTEFGIVAFGYYGHD